MTHTDRDGIMSSQRWASGALLALFLILLVLVTAGCGEFLGPGEPEPITELPRALTPPELSIIAGGNSFGLELWREVAARDPRPNLVLSPLSASMALGMTLNGAAGTTYEAMRSTLGFAGVSQEEINAAYRSLIELLVTLDPDVVFTIANSVWANQDVTFHQEFFDAVTAAFDATVESRDFSSPATLGDINGWVDDKTRGHIDRILDELSPDLVMLLLNAIYFDASWTTRFDPADTRAMDFRRPDGSTVAVQMMSMEDQEFPIAQTTDYAAIEFPYGGEAFSMVVVVPTPDIDARTLLAGMSESRWQALLDGLTSRRMDQISIPKLRLAYDGLLNQPLMAMGMDEAFRPGADFTGMSPAGGRFCIDFVRQKTFIEVDEEGTTAAAVTAVGIMPTSLNWIVADRPYLFAIRERLSGTLMFVGLIEDPTLEDSGPAEGSTTCS